MMDPSSEQHLQNLSVRQVMQEHTPASLSEAAATQCVWDAVYFDFQLFFQQRHKLFSVVPQFRALPLLALSR